MRDTPYAPLPDRLRIALMTHSVNPRGGVVHTLELAKALHEAGHHVTVFAPAARGEGFFRPVPHAVELMQLPDITGDLAARVAARIDACVTYLQRVLPREAYDVLHAQDSISGNALAVLREQHVISDYVRTVHHLDTFDDPRLMLWQQHAFTRAGQVLCVSRLWCETLARDHCVDAAQVHNGVDRTRYRPEAGPADEAVALRFGLAVEGPVFLAVGGIEARKNTVRILRAFARVRAVFRSARLVIAGGATLLDHGESVAAFGKALQALGLRAGPGEAVVITGTVPDSDMPALFRLADVVLMPSLSEGFGLAVLEALASGTPVVVSRIAPFTEYLEPAGAGWVWAEPESVVSIADAMARAADPARAAALRSAPPAVLDRFTWASSAARHVVLYRARHALSRLAAPASE